MLNFKPGVYLPEAGSGFNACLSFGWTALTTLWLTEVTGAQAVKAVCTRIIVKKEIPFHLNLEKSGVIFS
ncbi:hypothetical protein BIX56_03375 [Mycoplasmoides pneumoniae]|uniref:hypothetical protein n=1 Tax=Mycoplasmoides pneumoniae TaxID=2104 RepID=UPI000376E5BE|nr:hypothetical protein [Mycoplasmoides pneumoniae]ALA30755.1 hypothetical protein B434_01015 [Mycoplasmoides pneumoniae 19294]ALA32568.1 hypothetical protein F533_03360 [Mycoplasmoides pneumoniae 51494]ALA38211.1 hypothetical protein G667_03335 [Mycoplasmoides pneumoniae M2592]ALA39614.1 hypothetical protein C680_03355 [Mycoplasmoides pneumoniae PO1]ARQ38987.1 hypothetical protein BIX59_03365 [Mycoplasmoides pneumoniae]